MTATTVVFIALLFTNNENVAQQFRFGNMYGDHMVLQASPYLANIWGFTSIQNDSLSVRLIDSDSNEPVQTVDVMAMFDNEFNANIWTASLGPISASFSNYTISVESWGLISNITLKNIMFGDVFICSGQSNMGVTMSYVINASMEIQNANNYPFIRIFDVASIGSDEPQIELENIKIPWSKASNNSVPSFSAVCFFYGRDLYDKLNYPLGLIETQFGGTSIPCWCSKSVLKQCNATNATYDYSKINDTQLWNAMIYPFLKTTIKGAIWYQGEDDSNSLSISNNYNCLLKSMINDWRLQWSLRSDTSGLFPFGIVQLSVWGDSNNVTCGDNADCTSTAVVRYAQTGNYGYLPNPDMLNTFFATAIDLGDENAPNQIHPRYKQQVGKRLADSALNIIYGESEIYVFGPIAQKAIYNESDHSVIVNFRNVGEYGFEIKHFVGFEVLNNGHWIVANQSVTPTSNFDISIALSSSSNNNNITMIRYNFYRAPCLPDDGILNCAIYDQQYQLPAIPFILQVE